MSIRNKSNRFWVESKDNSGTERIVAHGQDEETGEMYYQFLSRTQANKLIKDEKKIKPEYKYRVVREVTEWFKTNWE